MSSAVESAIEVRELVFSYPRAGAPIFSGLSFAVPAGARCLLLGANGVGKSTLLRLVGGRHMIPPGMLRVLGRAAFGDARLASEVAFLGGPFPFAADIRVAEILAGRLGVDPRRRGRLLQILDVDPNWRLHQVSDGQRCRVQMLLDLERTLSVILLDEVTDELDVLARADLLAFLREESVTRGVTVVYASHALDGLDDFATHLMFLSPGRLRCLVPIAEALQLGAAQPGGGASPLHRLCERWMREDRSAAQSARLGESSDDPALPLR
ncbi:MAG TPA: ATP-binding cassette domain-containing protein [Polyangia bacterium]|nr:ATP-binding cassette domain-containing protein [Polyangia bacterium]